MSTDFQKSLVLTHNEIARRAYEIYLERGAIAGNHEAHWSLAEQELKARLQFEELLRKFKSSLPRQWAKSGGIALLSRPMRQGSSRIGGGFGFSPELASA